MSSVRVLAILQARVSSRRLPGKVLLDLAGAPMILRQIERVRRCKLIDRLVVATSSDASDDPLAETLASAGIDTVRGDLNDVLGRFAATLALFPAEQVVRLTADCPLADPEVIDAVIGYHLLTAADLTTNAVQSKMPDGLDAEVVRAGALLVAANEAVKAYEREHVTQFLYRRPDRFKLVDFPVIEDLGHLRWTVDEPEDLAFVRAIYERLYPLDAAFGFRDVLRLLQSAPELYAVNSRFERNEGLARSISKESPAD